MPPPRRRSEPRKVSFSNPDKILFPESGTTKAEMIRYYIDVSRWMLPHLEDRPITMVRFPDGVGGHSFFEKNAPGFTPGWVTTFPVPRRRHEGVIKYILVNDADTLAWCANLAAIELHPFLHRVPQLDRPTHVAFDLDPGEGADILTCAEVALHLKQLCEGLGLQAWPKVSGSKGVQVYVPLNTPVTYDQTQPFARAVAELLEREHPKLIVSNMAKARRKNRVLVDWSQNSASKTTVAVYAMRAKRARPWISMPVEWRELERAADAGDPDRLFFSPEAALRRLKKGGDLFSPVLTVRQRLPEAFTGGSARPSTKKTTKKKTMTGKTRRARAAAPSLDTYAAKRDFSTTAEPPPARLRRSRQGSRRRFVVQKHVASHLHYDFRLELDDTLKSWAVPKGLPSALKVKRSAFQTEDHPLDYLDFEGTIPAGQYGGGTVMVWDTGTYEIVGGSYDKGSLHVFLRGGKLEGEWHLYRIREDDGKPVWLVEKRGKAMRPIGVRRDDTSALTGRSMKRIAADNDAQWQSAPAAARPSRKPARPAAVGGPLPRPRAGGRRRVPVEPAFVEPMAARAVTELPEGPQWLYEVKWDGYRALAIKHDQNVRLLSRRNRSMAAEFPEIVQAVAGIRAHTAMLDGEIVALDPEGRPSFERLQQRGSTSARPLVYYVFDLLNLDGQDLMSRPLSERRQQLAAVLTDGAPPFSAELPGAAADIVAAVSRMGFEGVMAKRRDGVYEPGERSGAWRKLRLARQQEFVIGGYRPGLRSFESVLVGTYEQRKLMYAGKVRAGFNPRTRRDVADLIRPDRVGTCPFANLPTRRGGRWGAGITASEMKELCWVKPKHVIQVAFVEWTAQGGLRHASFKGIRDDKPARDVVREPIGAVPAEK